MTTLKAVQAEVDKVAHEGVIVDGLDMWTKQGSQWLHNKGDKPYTLRQVALFIKNKRAAVKEKRNRASKLDIGWELWQGLQVDGTISTCTCQGHKFWCFTGYSGWYPSSVTTEEARNSDSYSQLELINLIYNNQ